nr:hypothetical protein [Nocardia cyriacigeorgica]
MSGDLLVEHEDSLEDRLVQPPADLVARSFVHLVRIAEQFQAGVDVLRPRIQTVDHLTQRGLKLVPFPLDLCNPSPDPPGWQCAVLGQLDQVRLLGVQILELVLEVLPVEPLRCLALGARVFHRRSHEFDELRRECNRFVVLDHQVFDAVQVAEARLATASPGAAAKDIGVLDAMSIRGLVQEHSADRSVPTAVAAEQTAFDVAVVDATALASHAVLIEDSLDTLEGLVINERFVTAGDLFFVLIGDDAEVVALAEDPRPLLAGHGLRSPLGSSAGQQAAFLHDSLDVEEAVVARGIQLEGCLDEWTTLRIDLDCADLAPVVHRQRGVQIANRRLSECAALFCLLAHLVSDVGSVFP